MAILYGTDVNKDTEAAVDDDRLVREFIESNPGDDYDSRLGRVDNWQMFYHLSSMRNGLLNWYGFEKTCKVLEIGAQFGALTGTLCDRCGYVFAIEANEYRTQALFKRYSNRENLAVFYGDFQDIEPELTKQLPGGFDYIILNEVLENQFEGSNNRKLYTGYLEQAGRLLCPNGRLLIAADNRYGIKYFCGAPESHTNRPFDGINHYPEGTKGYSFSRQELEDIICKAGFQTKFYYCLPDSKLPQLIYSDDYMKGSSINERLVPYYTDSSSLLAYEKTIYADIMENRVLHFFANSFLVECSRDGEFCKISYAAVSTDRGKEHGFATTIHSDGTVEKVCLHKAGRDSMELIYQNLQEMHVNGVKIIEHVYQDGRLSMPFIEGPTLSNEMQECLPENPDRFVWLFELLYESILKSSAEIPENENMLRKKYNCKCSFGPILNKVYMDMVPINCFFKNNELYFFDQEFVREKYPAGYVLYRAIKYTYMYMPQAEQMIRMEDLKKKFHLSEAWEIYEKDEEEFIDSNRNFEIYGQFYKWASVDLGSIYQRAGSLKGI